VRWLSPHSTLEELHLAGALVRGLGSENIDHRLRHAEFAPALCRARYLGTSIASLSQLQRVLVVGSNLRKDHPLFAQRIRQATKRRLQGQRGQREALADWAMPLAHTSRRRMLACGRRRWPISPAR